MKALWLDLVYNFWLIAYAMVTSPGQVLPESPFQTKLYTKAMSARLDVENLSREKDR